MKKFFITTGALVALVVPSAAMADKPTGQPVFKSDAWISPEPGANLVGLCSSVQIQNGQFIGGNHGVTDRDQTTEPGSRADEVQYLLSLSGRGSLAKQHERP